MIIGGRSDVGDLETDVVEGEVGASEGCDVGAGEDGGVCKC